MSSYAEIARRGFKAAARGDYDALAAILDPEVRWHGGDPDAEGACLGRGQALAWMRGREARGAGPFPELVEVLESGERVAVIMRHAPTPDDPQARLVANLATFRDGLVVEMVHYFDAEDARAALLTS